MSKNSGLPKDTMLFQRLNNIEEPKSTLDFFNLLDFSQKESNQCKDPGYLYTKQNFTEPSKKIYLNNFFMVEKEDQDEDISKKLFEE